MSYDYSFDDKLLDFIFADEHQFENFKDFVRIQQNQNHNLWLDFNDDIN